MSKYIFLIGAPGSKWSSVSQDIYRSESVDRSDQSKHRQYYHSAWGEPELMHVGAYWDPGMEFGKRFMQMNQLTKEECEFEFNRAFAPATHHRPRVIKSHVFAHNLDYLKNNWPDCPIVLVYRPNDACIGWWVRCGQFNITYPNYQYYSNLNMMAMHIDLQNKDIQRFAVQNFASFDVITDNNSLCDKLQLQLDDPTTIRSYRDYREADLQVAVIT